jgi:hypothetical protein
MPAIANAVNAIRPTVVTTNRRRFAAWALGEWQHRLYFFPLPQGQGSLLRARTGFDTKSLSSHG